ncbi:MAG: beta-ketoacyl-ACP reductase [Acidimicrobiia bacterium]
MTDPVGGPPLATLIDLRGRVAVVAGGAGAIGAAIALRLVECGARTFSLDLPGRTAQTGVTPVEADLTEEASLSAALAEVDRHAGRIDVVVHAAGISRDARVWKLDPVDWDAVVATNLRSAFLLLRGVVPRLRQAGGGSVVLISSINGDRGKVGLSAYAASKAGLHALARTAARETGAFNIRVNALAPGWITSPMTDALPEAVRERALNETVCGRLGTPDDVARMAVVLATDLGRHVTGQVIRVDGGQLIG